MSKKLNPARWLLAFIVTLLVIPAIVLSMLVLPVDLIALNKESYSEIIGDAQYTNQMNLVVAEVVTDQVLFTGEVPLVLGDTRAFKTALSEYLPQEWVSSVLQELLSNTLDYFNFQTPYAAIEIGIVDFKQTIARESEAIAGDYVLSLETCQAADGELAQAAQMINEYPLCKPGNDAAKKLTSLISVYLQDRVNRLPNSLNLVGLIPSGLVLGERTFYWYSIARWVFRLLPFVALIFLILLAVLLKPNKKLMRGWIGWLLAVVSGVMLVAGVVILIGMDQFIGLLFNRSFSKLIAGFGNVLLSIAHFVGNLITVWVIAQAGAVFLFGLILLLAAKYSRVKSPDYSDDQQEDEADLAEEAPEKTIIPQTMEEIEQEEKENGEAE